MNTEQALAFFLFSVVAAITPGPSNIMLTATGVSAGVIRGLPCLLGVVSGMALMMFLAAFGLGYLLLDQPRILPAIKWLGAVFLLWLAWKIAGAEGSSSTTDQRPVGFTAAAAFQWVNPKSWLVCTSAAATYLQTQTGSALLQALLFAVLFVLAAFPSCLLWLTFGALLQRFLHKPRVRRLFNISMGVVLAGSVILFI
jgi:threonine/homoserine/homoserine lactone efflux protein